MIEVNLLLHADDSKDSYKQKTEIWFLGSLSNSWLETGDDDLNNRNSSYQSTFMVAQIHSRLWTVGHDRARQTRLSRWATLNYKTRFGSCHYSVNYIELYL